MTDKFVRSSSETERRRQRSRKNEALRPHSADIHNWHLRRPYFLIGLGRVFDGLRHRRDVSPRRERDGVGCRLQHTTRKRPHLLGSDVVAHCHAGYEQTRRSAASAFTACSLKACQQGDGSDPHPLHALVNTPIVRSCSPCSVTRFRPSVLSGTADALHVTRKMLEAL